MSSGGVITLLLGSNGLRSLSVFQCGHWGLIAIPVMLQNASTSLNQEEMRAEVLSTLSKMVVNTTCLQAGDFNKGGAVNPNGKSIGMGRDGHGMGSTETPECSGCCSWMDAQRQDKHCTALRSRLHPTPGSFRAHVLQPSAFCFPDHSGLWQLRRQLNDATVRNASIVVLGSGSCKGAGTKAERREPGVGTTLMLDTRQLPSALKIEETQPLIE